MVAPEEERQISGGKVASYSSILEEHDVARGQRDLRKKLLQELSSKSLNDGHEPNGVIAHISRGSLAGNDIPVLGDLLRDLGDVHTLSLLIHSPGGDGTVVEKFVSLCRAQCKHFRVIIPNEAKSAATLIALGADQIIMGPPSELGPIDAQIPVLANGLYRLISAQSFIDARDDLLKKHKEALAKNEDTSAILQMLATLDLPFISECERMMDLGRDIAKKLLEAHMFKKMAKRAAKIDKVVTILSSVQRFKSHGRMIDGNMARRELSLKVSLSGQADPLWKKAWEYYTRAEIALGQSSAGKMFETEHNLLIAGAAP
jgi:ClpP class serine protease